MLCHIVAVSENNVIGSRNGLPWKLATDFAYFKNKTWGLPVIMGRKTYESMDVELAGRINIVITNQPDWQRDKVAVVKSIEDAIAKAKESDAKEIFIIGGGEIFKQTIGMVDRIYRTRVHAHVEGDTFYPEIDAANWKLTSERSFPADEKNNYPFTFEVWDKLTIPS
ncbi:MAG TPA: dihydrofolate reductase [Chitinophagaceae bacterium]|nr:dihydrofolate reductase [Chitinophagaceae bacterium]